MESNVSHFRTDPFDTQTSDERFISDAVFDNETDEEFKNYMDLLAVKQSVQQSNVKLRAN